MSRAFALERLQSIDLEIDDKTKLSHLVEQKLLNDPAIATARAALDQEEQHLSDLSAQLRAREMDGKSLDAKIKGMEERLYGGTVSNPKELDGLEKELEMFKRQRSGLDDRILELMDAVDQAQGLVKQHSAAFRQMEAARAASVEHLSRERDQLAARLAALAAERESTRASVDADSLRTYDRLRQTKAGRAVATIRQNSCSVCGVTVPTGLVQRARAGAELVLCSGCGRILAG